MTVTETPVAALDKAKKGRESDDEFESECPRYCSVQDTFDVGTLKVVGRIYQQTFVMIPTTRWFFLSCMISKYPLRPATCSMIDCYRLLKGGVISITHRTVPNTIACSPTSHRLNRRIDD